LIAGLALLAFGSGPVRGFAVVHCIGILTSMFSAVFFSRGLVNLWYGGKKKLKTLAIGQVWRPATAQAYDGADGAAPALSSAAGASSGASGASGLAVPEKGKTQRAGKPQLRNRAREGAGAGASPRKPGSSR
jgi:preprotein translocase subunit SecD